MSTKISTDNETVAAGRRANDFLTGAVGAGEPEPLFDEFWQEGELAMMFGAPSSGKSVLAVQIGDALARGGGISLFRAAKGRRRVLYVDLRHTDRQFQMRCTEGRAVHKFPQNLFRDRPAAGTDLCEWLRAYISANGIQAVIVDDLSAVRQTHDGTRETLKLMRQLRQIRDEMAVSILVIADSQGKPGRVVTEADLGRSRVLCSVADSVFALGRGLREAGDHYLVQTRVRSRPIRWGVRNALVGQINRSASGLLEVDLDDRFAATDPARRDLMMQIAFLVREKRKTFREIAKLLGISRSWACTLFKRIPPSVFAPRVPVLPQQAAPQAASQTPLLPQEGWPQAGVVEPSFSSTNAERTQTPQAVVAEPSPSPTNAQRPYVLIPQTLNPHRQPFAAALRRPRIRDLETQLNAYGRVMFVEQRYNDGKPMVWYQQRPTGDYARHHRNGYAIQIQNLGPSGHIPLSRRHALRL